jgi:hypothetical protein
MLWRVLALLAATVAVLLFAFIAFLANVEENCNNGIPRFLCSDFADNVAPVLAELGLIVIALLTVNVVLTVRRERR